MQAGYSLGEGDDELFYENERIVEMPKSTFAYIVERTRMGPLKSHWRYQTHAPSRSLQQPQEQNIRMPAREEQHGRK